MKTKDYVILISCSLFLGWVLTSGKSTPKPIVKDTIKTVVDTPIVHNVKNKTVLFIGDSHTANKDFGWQQQLCKITGMKGRNVAVGGKMTPWMLSMAKQHLDSSYDYCFVYGGANDCYSLVSVEKTIVNIQAIADLCKAKGVKCVVLTGFDPLTCVRVNSNYPQLYAKLQRMMLTQLRDCEVVDCRKAVVRTNCWDNICHMNYDGHKNMANCIVDSCGFKRY
jgi:hypothetical protein